ncbi:MAG: tripartite tricarboxylate transporter substrate binding protein [Burkholderiales bacterium]|nr:tripartite tricarboxylate transporter substrate binding protein [Burkholderiales bacterium]
MNTLACCVSLAAAALALASVPAPAAGDYPVRPVRILIPFVPGGSTDFTARVMQPGLAEALGQPLVLDNRPGASGNIAVEMAARASPDGYTVLFGNVGTIAINPALFRRLPVDPMRDLACVNIAANVSSMLVVHPSLPVRSLGEFIAHAKSRPGQINWGSAAAGNPATLGMQYLAHKTGLDLVLVAYKGAGAAATALVSGEVTAGFVAVPATLPFVRAGQLRALVVRSAKRLDVLPNVPTITEAGFPELTNDSWQGLFVPARTPAAVVERLAGAVSRVLRDPKVVERLRASAASAIDTETARACAAFVKEQAAFWSGIVRQVGMEGKL